MDSARERGKPGSSELGACVQALGLSPASILALAPLLLQTIWLCPSDDYPLPWPQALSQEACSKSQCDLELTSDLPGIPHTPWELVLSLVSTENFLEHHPTFSAGPPNPALLQPPPLSHRCVWWPGPRWDPRHRQRSAGKEAGQTGGQAVSRPSVPPETEPPLSICSHSPRLCFYSQFTSVFRTKRGRCWGRAPLPACHFVILFA